MRMLKSLKINFESYKQASTYLSKKDGGGAKVYRSFQPSFGSGILSRQKIRRHQNEGDPDGIRK